MDRFCAPHRWPLSLWIAPLLAVTLIGCQGLAEERARQAAIAAEQKAIATYSEAVESVDQFQTAFVNSWKQANEIKDVRAFAEAVRATVIPALEQYVDRLGAMPTGTADLKRIHTIVTGAYATASSDFRAFEEDLSDATIEERYQILLAKMDVISKAESRYVAALSEYYARNQVRLLNESP